MEVRGLKQENLGEEGRSEVVLSKMKHSCQYFLHLVRNLLFKLLVLLS